MKTKKTLCLALILTLLMMLTTVISSAASPSITVSSVEAKAGETVTIQISIHNNPGIVGMGLDVSYGEQLSLTNVADGGILGDSVHPENYSLNPYRLTWANDTTKTNFSENGTLATFTFKVADNAPAGKYTVSVSYNNDNFDIFNVDAETVDFTVSSGNITVTEPIHTQHTWDAGKVTKTATCKEEGVKELTCTVCGEKKTEMIAIDASNHADYGTEVTGKKAATETAKGYTGDTVCKGCGTVLQKGEELPPIPPTPHKQHNLTKTEGNPATCTEAGFTEGEGYRRRADRRGDARSH